VRLLHTGRRAHIYDARAGQGRNQRGRLVFIDEIYSLFGFKYHIELSTMPEDHMGELADWESATDALRAAAMDEIGSPIQSTKARRVLRPEARLPS
jgi:threonyl-tRNA synthetase